MVFHLLKAIREDNLSKIDFEWVKVFENSILGDDAYSGIIPTLLVLKRFAKTEKDNVSLRSVLAKKLYDIRLQVSGGAPEEELSDTAEPGRAGLASFYLAKDEERSMSPQAFRDQNNESAGVSLYKDQEQNLTKNKRASSTNRN